MAKSQFLDFFSRGATFFCVQTGRFRDFMKTREGCFFSAVFVFSLLLGCGISCLLGLDRSPDQRNYHLYNAWAFCEGRMETDLYPAGFHSYLNPLVDVPSYLISVKWFRDSPNLAAFLSGIPSGLFVFTGFLLVFFTLKRVLNFSGFSLYFFSCLLTLSGVFLPWVFGTFDVIHSAITGELIFLSLLSIFWLKSRPIPAALGMGFFLGVANGLKFTTVSNLPALFFVLLFLLWKDKRLFRCILFFFLSWGVAFSLIYGFQGIKLFQLFANPVFPCLDKIFPNGFLGKNDIANTMSYASRRPTSLLKIILAPFDRSVVTMGLLPSSFAIAFFFLLQIFAKIGITSRFLKQRLQISDAPPILTALCLFHIISILVCYPIFVCVFLYLKPNMFLSGLILFSVFFHVFQNYWKRLLPCAPTLFLAAGICVSARSGYFEFREYKRNDVGVDTKEIQVPALPANSLILTARETSCMAPFLFECEPTLVFIGGLSAFDTEKPMFDCRMKEKIAKKIKDHTGPVFLIGRINTYKMWPDIEPQKLFPQYGLDCKKNISDADFHFQTCYGEFFIFRCTPQTTSR